MIFRSAHSPFHKVCRIGLEKFTHRLYYNILDLCKLNLEKNDVILLE